MQFKIPTPKMSYILSKVAKGVGKKYTLPITDYILITLNEGVLSIRATDGTNFLTVIEKDVAGEDGQAIVKADTLIKLVDKTTKQELSFSLKDSYLEVKGNGVYKVPIITEEYPSYEFDVNAPTTELSAEKLKWVFSVNKSAIAKDLVIPFFTGFNIGDTCITTDGIKMCINNTSILEERVLLTQHMASLISSTVTDEKVRIQRDGNNILVSSDGVVIFGPQLDGLSEYPDITGILSYEFDSSAVVSKSELLESLDRLSLFVDPFDNNGIRLSFTEGTLEITDFKENSVETLSYVADSTIHGAVVTLNLDMFKDILSVLVNDAVAIQYNSENASTYPIKIVENDVTLILGTMSV
jgi:DNA polymerase-3 subunit beta